MFKIVLCLGDTAARRAVEALCAEYFARLREPLELAVLPAEPAAAQPALKSADLIFFAAGHARPNGLDTAAQLRAAGSSASFVFLAAGPEYAMNAFGVSALQYLVPPVSPPRLFETLDRTLLSRRGRALAVATPRGVCGVPFGDIEFVECPDHVLHFHLVDGRGLRSATLRVPLSQALAPLLADARFYQPHRSFVVNLDRVRQLNDAGIAMESGAAVPVPRGRAAEAREAYLAALEPRRSHPLSPQAVWPFASVPPLQA